MFLASARGKYKALDQFSRMLELHYRPHIFCEFYRSKGRNDGTLMEWENVDVLKAICSLLILIENSVVKLRPWKAAIQGRYEK